METDEMTPTLKVRRNVVMKNFAAEIKAMYDDKEAKDPAV
jgi:long-subunit acyl-CoA synthetase (AMP-forming)